MTRPKRKFWGWGLEDEQPSPKEVERIGLGARKQLGFGPADVERPPRLEDVRLPPARLESPASLAPICRSDLYERALHSYGRAYRDVVRAFRGRFDHPPDVVAHPRDERDVEHLLEWCADVAAAAVPFGGGTSVVGGVEPRVPQEAAISIDLKGMSGVLEVDSVSRSARIAAGTTGPQLEAELNGHGLTLRHYPQSFEFSTLGGWIATRAAGHFATLHTHIDDFVEAVRAVTPRGIWESPPPSRVGSGAQPGPYAGGLGGHPRRDHRGLGSSAGGPPFPRSPPPCCLVRLGKGPLPCGPLPSRVCFPRTAGCSTRLRPH